MGIPFSCQREQVTVQTFDERLTRFKNYSLEYERTTITLVRLLLLTFLIPKLLYVSSITESPHDASRKMEQRIYKFLWKGPAKVISNSVIITLQHGGSKPN